MLGILTFTCIILPLSSVSAKDKTTLYVPATPEIEPTSREAFLTVWEQHIKSLPTTVTFEKTDTPNVYNFETILFPYKGNLELLNIVIDESVDYYYDYDLDQAAKTRGVAEIRLPELPDDFFEKHYNSASVWNKQHYLFFIDRANQWMSPQQWKTWREHNISRDESYEKSTCSTGSWADSLKPFSSIIILLIFLVLLFFFTHKQQKKQIAKYDLSMDRQKEAIEQQQEAMDIAQKALDLQEQQVTLLKQILDQKNKG